MKTADTYQIPKMSEISNVRKNGFNVVSTFSGCGGTCLGFKMDGYKVLWANEFISSAESVYKFNHPEVIISNKDIRAVTATEILSACEKRQGEIDVLEGSPPCASFSSSGQREKNWKLV